MIGLAVIASVAFCRAAELAVAPSVSLSEPHTDADAVIHYEVTSPYQAGRTTLRILAPKSSTSTAAKRILFVLPVEPGEEHHYGDGLDAVRQLGVHEKLGWIVVAPSFSHWPWYADHPSDPAKQDESYMLKAVIPLVDRLYPSPPRKRLLLGFSKSGWGAFSLILRHPDLFEAAAAWDAPLMKDKPDAYEMPQAFESQANFEQYQISRLLTQRANPFQSRQRLGLYGYGNFREHVTTAHDLMDRLRIRHDYANDTHRDHVWASGWIESAVQALDTMSKD